MNNTQTIQYIINMKTEVYAAFCGTGKTTFCNISNKKTVEVEFWKYKEKDTIDKYIYDVKNYIGSVDYIFVATDPEGLKLLYDNGIEFILVVPDKKLRNEYLDRYLNRNSSYEFIGAFMKWWNVWIDELTLLQNKKTIILQSGQYLSDVIQIN